MAMPQKIAIDPYSPNIKCFDGKVIKSGQNNLIERTCPQGVTRCIKFENDDLPKRPIDGVAETPENFKNALTFKCGENLSKEFLELEDGCFKLDKVPQPRPKAIS